MELRQLLCFAGTNKQSAHHVHAYKHLYTLASDSLGLYEGFVFDAKFLDFLW